MAKAGSNSKKKTASKKTSKKKSDQKESTGKATATHADEPLGLSSVPDDVQLPVKSGKAGVFGGPKDRGFKPDDKLALPTGPHFAYERIRTLNPNSFYCAMRWDYHLLHMSPEEGKRWWANKKLQVTNPKNGASIIVRAVDYGPHESTGLDISVSPGAAEALGIEIGDEVEIAFADQKASLGPAK